MWLTTVLDSLPSLLAGGRDAALDATSLALLMGITPPSELRPARIGLRHVIAALREGHAMYRATLGTSTAYAAFFVLIGALLFLVLDHAEIAPLSLSVAGGFMLVGPALLAGFFALADCRESGEAPRLGHVWQGFRGLPRDGWAISFVCALLLLIWLTDAGTLYGFMVGQTPTTFRHFMTGQTSATKFVAFSSLMGAALALIIFTVSAFSIPLIHYRRATLVRAVVASARAVFGQFPIMLCWASLLAGVIIASAWMLPLLLYTLPVMAYASRALYRQVLPPV